MKNVSTRVSNRQESNRKVHGNDQLSDDGIDSRMVGPECYLCCAVDRPSNIHTYKVQTQEIIKSMYTSTFT